VYVVNLRQAPRIGDGKLARVVETKEMTGQEIIDAGNSVNFNEVKHTSLLLVPELLEDPQVD
jgi:hypothetical protein